MTTNGSNVPMDHEVLEGEVIPPVEDPKPRSGKFAQMTSDEDVKKVQEVYTTLKPYLRVAGKAAVLTLAPETYYAAALAEGVQTTRQYLKDRKESRALKSQA